MATTSPHVSAKPFQSLRLERAPNTLEDASLAAISSSPHQSNYGCNNDSDTLQLRPRQEHEHAAKCRVRFARQCSAWATPSMWTCSHCSRFLPLSAIVLVFVTLCISCSSSATSPSTVFPFSVHFAYTHSRHRAGTKHTLIAGQYHEVTNT